MRSVIRKLRFFKVQKNKAVDVNYFQHRRWQLVTLLEKFVGVWPYQSKFARYSLQIFYLLVLTTIILAIMNDLWKYIGVDIAMTIEGIILILFVFSLGVKSISAFKSRDDRRKIYEIITKHYETMTDSEEAMVLKKFANRGYKLTVIFIGVVGIFVGLFDSLPSIKVLYQYFISDGKLNLILPVPLDYGVDHKKYWYGIALHFTLFVYTGFIVDAAFDLPFILQVHHVRALFKIVRMRLDKASTLASQLENRIIKHNDEKSNSIILTAIDLHKEVIEMAALIEKTYSNTWGILMFLNCAVFGAAIHMIILRLHDPIETLRNICAFIILLMHFQLIFSQGQSIIDSSSSIHAACSNCKWYNFTMKSRKLLCLMMTRSTVPCKLTGAQFFPLTMEMFTKMLKAGISYYTVFQQ